LKGSIRMKLVGAQPYRLDVIASILPRVPPGYYRREVKSHWTGPLITPATRTVKKDLLEGLQQGLWRTSPGHYGAPRYWIEA